MDSTTVSAALTTQPQRRVASVLERIAAACAADQFIAEAYSDALDQMCEDLLGEDFFGTEGQSDPRGDQRNGDWSMDRVEGVDE